MFQNYLVTALRNLIRHKLYSFINIAGLAVGLACAIFILLFMRDELILRQTGFPIRKTSIASSWRSSAAWARPASLHRQYRSRCPHEMRNEIPEVTAMTRLYNNYSMTLTVGDRQFLPARSTSVDSNFFRVITSSLWSRVTPPTCSPIRSRWFCRKARPVNILATRTRWEKDHLDRCQLRSYRHSLLWAV